MRGRGSVRPAIIAVLSALPLVLSQGTATAFEGGSVRMPLEFRSWTVETEGADDIRVEQVVVPLTASVALSPSSRLVASMSVGFATYDDGSVSHTLDGPSDLEIQLYQGLPSGRVLFFGGVRVPTGTRSLDADQLVVSEAIALPVLGMPLREYGRGLDLNAGLAGTVPAGAVELVWGLGGRLAGPYDLAADRDEFTPGAQGSASLGLQWTERGAASARTRLSFQAAYRLYGKDQVGGDDVFQEGSQIELKGRAELPAGRTRTELRALAVVKGANESYGRDADVPPVELDSGLGLFGSAEVRYALAPTVQAGLGAEARVFDGNESAQRDGSAFGFGPTFGFAFGGGGWVWLRGHYLVGTAGEGQTKQDLTGFGGGVSLVWRVR